MACETPVIATENSGASDLIHDGVEGYIVPIRAPDVMAERLQALADARDLRAAMGIAAREKIQSLGGWNHYGDQYRNLCLALTS
jgi:alpha-maltose-1-phosphate synthase